MGDFDDVLAMEPSDEWDDYDPSTHAGPTVELPPLVAQLRVPAATIELRGDVPAPLLTQLDALTATPAVSSPYRVVVPVSLAASDDDPCERWQLTDHDRGEVVGAFNSDDLAEWMTTQLRELAVDADVRQLVVPLAAVRLADGRGVLLVEPDADRRHELVAAMVDGGAAYLGADHVVLQPGSRTVSAFPTPLRTDTALTADQVAPVVTISVVVVPEQDATSAEPLTRANGCARLLATALPDTADAQELVRSLAGLTAAAAVWAVPAADPAAFSAAVAALPDPMTHDLVTSRRPLGTDGDLVTVRFAHGGVVADLGVARALELDESELGTVDALRWSVVATTPESDAALITQLAGAGVDLQPVVAAGVMRSPGPESYGLEDSPRGAAARSLWDAAAIGRAGIDDPALAVLLAHAARHGEVVLDAPLAELVAPRVAAADATRRRCSALLGKLLDLLGDEDVEPLVLGSFVLAHDGPVPAELVAVDRLELLLPPERIDASLAVLESCGGVLSLAGIVEPDAPTGGPLTMMFRGDDDGTLEVVVRDRLAAGPFGELVDHDDLRARAVRISVGDRWALALHPDDRFVWSCVRLADPATASLSELREVVLEAPRSRDGMAAALEASARWGATRTVLAAIRTVSTRLPGLSPWLVERATRPAPASERRRRRARRRV